jgi:hypothetical protein
MSTASIEPGRLGWDGPDLRRQQAASYIIEDVLAMIEDTHLQRPFEMRLPTGEITP